MRALILTFLMLAFLAVPASADDQITSPATVYELRTYYPAPGKAAALNARFREHTLKLFEKHGMVNIGYWNEQPTDDAAEGRLIYILAYPSRAAHDASWEAFRADPEWIEVAAASEVDGKLVLRVDSVFMTLADYSPALGPPR